MRNLQRENQDTGFCAIFVLRMSQIHFIGADEAVRAVRCGDHVHLSSIASVPHILIEALCRRADELTDIHFHHFHTEGPAPYGSAQYRHSFFDQGFFVGPNLRASVQAGVADYLPVNLYETQAMYRNGALRCDVAMVQVSEPVDGMVSLGTSVDCSVAALEVARERIAVVNPAVPFSYGNLIPVERFTALVQDNRPLVTALYSQPSDTDFAIGANCADLIPDGACLQMGIGSMPNAICAGLKGHKHLGLHTEMFSDGALQLIKSGVIDGSAKAIDRGQVVASFLLGSEEVYKFIDRNPAVQMRDIAYTNDPRIIAQNPGMVSINSAIEIDLTGQVCADSIGERIYSGTGGQLDFVRGAKLSRGGKAIIAMASRTSHGNAKIVPVLHPGAGVVTPRADIQWVVTEFGAVNLYGKSLQERAKLLISIAHPDDSESLERAAFNRFGR